MLQKSLVFIGFWKSFSVLQESLLPLAGFVSAPLALTVSRSRAWNTVLSLVTLQDFTFSPIFQYLPAKDPSYGLEGVGGEFGRITIPVEGAFITSWSQGKGYENLAAQWQKIWRHRFSWSSYILLPPLEAGGKVAVCLQLFLSPWDAARHLTSWQKY